jgi:hypothetical protein
VRNRNFANDFSSELFSVSVSLEIFIRTIVKEFSAKMFSSKLISAIKSLCWHNLNLYLINSFKASSRSTTWGSSIFYCLIKLTYKIGDCCSELGVHLARIVGRKAARLVRCRTWRRAAVACSDDHLAASASTSSLKREQRRFSELFSTKC